LRCNRCYSILLPGGQEPFRGAVTTGPDDSGKSQATAEKSVVRSAPEVPVSVWQRLKDHKVVQWTLAYAAAAYTMLHAVEMVSDALDWPHVVVRIVTLVLFLGGPVAATLAWYHGHRAQHRVSGPELAILTLLLVIAGSVLWFIGRPSQEHARDKAAASAPASTVAVPTATAPPEKSVAVLPFVDMSEKKDQEYLSDGLSEELINLLTKVQDLRVPARTSSFYFKGKQVTIAEIAKTLSVAHVLEGSVRKADKKVRITVQLIHVADGYHVWSETYDRDLKDIFKLQDEIASNVVQALKATLLAGPPRNAHTTTNVDAYALTLQGRLMLQRGSELDVHQAISTLERAVALDPSYAPAWANLSEAYFNLQDYGYLAPRETTPNARAAAERALALDPNFPDAHVALGWVKLYADHDWSGARAEFEAAHRADPSMLESDWLRFYSGCLSGPCYEEFVRNLSRLIDRDPVNAAQYLDRGNVHYRAGELEAAEQDMRHALNLSPSFSVVHLFLTQVLVLRHDYVNALSIAERAPEGLNHDLALAWAFDALGRRGEADRAIQESLTRGSFIRAYQLARIYAARGDRATAWEWLDRAFAERDGLLLWLKVDPAMRQLAHEPRFKALLSKMNFPE
jgi:TolB-like protein